MTRIARFVARLAVVAAALAGASCGELTRQGQSPANLVIDSLEGARGDEPETFNQTLASDVVTDVDGVPTIFADIGRASFRIMLKDPGPPQSPATPSPNNAITIERYRVTYIRADGRNTPGVDVPYGFDGAVTITVPENGSASTAFVLVRHVAKAEAPLGALRSNLVVLSTIAEVTFYGHDQTGREVSATGRIGIEFGNF